MAGGGAAVLVCCIALAAFAVVEGRDHLVGGKSGAWTIPSSSDSNSLTNWSQKSRFQVGDSLVWKYDAKKDSVLEVTRDAYLSCNTSSPISQDDDGDTKVVLDHSGPYYFISGAESHCDKGQKVIVVVMSPRNHRPPIGTAAAAASPAPSPSLDAVEGPTSAAASAFKQPMFMVVALGASCFWYMTYQVRQIIYSS